jgi:ABC-type transport system involved in cytochrome c biogenesis permease subunit
MDAASPPEEIRMKRLSLFLLCLLSLTAFAQEPVPSRTLRAFGDLPVLHDGRVMPMDTYARLALLQFSGRSAFGKEPAISWFARLLFVPDSTRDDAFFLVNHPEVLDAMGVPRFQALPGQKKPSTRRFTYSHLVDGMGKLAELYEQAQKVEPKQRDLVAQEAVRLFENLITYRQLASVFTHERPIPGLQIPLLRERLGLPADVTAFSYSDLKDRLPAITDLVQAAAAQDDPDALTPEQREALGLASYMFGLRTALVDMPLPLLPAAPHGEPHWLAPLDALHDEERDVQLVNAAKQSGLLSTSWVAGDWQKAREAIDDIGEFSQGRMKHVREVRNARAEARFNRANYFFKAKMMYIACFFLAFAALISGNRSLRLAAWIPLSLALLFHVTGLGWRIFLTARPPVTNLYGTFLFVGLICLLLALLVEAFQKNGLGLFTGSFVAIIFLFVADRFGAEGDTMKKVVAVLASNFWLSTHVLAVTTGYAGVWIAGVFGHIWLVLKLLNKPKDLLDKVRLPMEGLLGFGLTFAFLGTMLGGVWADQSWGRFWGWDPKENGALLIVLWSAAVYHARIAGLIREIGMAAGAVIGCIMVMVAWLGVNLLNVGLHSYGFTQSMFSGFIGYIAFELLFLAVVLGLLQVQSLRKQPKAG